MHIILRDKPYTVKFSTSHIILNIILIVYSSVRVFVILLRVRVSEGGGQEERGVGGGEEEDER